MDYFHPSARSFSQRLISRDRDFNYTGNPLDDFSVMHFLDKFMYKPAKEKQIHNKYAPNRGTTLRQASLLTANRPRTMNSSALIQMPPDMVRDDEKFFFKFMKEKDRREKKEKEYTIQNKVKHDPKLRMAEQLKNERMLNERDLASQMEDEEDDNVSDTSSVYSYTDLASAWNDNDLEDSQVDNLLMQYASSSDDEDNEFIQEERDKMKQEARDNKKKKRDFGYDVVEGDIDDTAKPNQEEMAVLLEEAEDAENDSDDDVESASKRNSKKRKHKSSEKGDKKRRKR